MTVDHMETSRERSDMDVSITEGELAKTGSVYTYEDAGPSTKKVRALTQFLAMLFIRF